MIGRFIIQQMRSVDFDKPCSLGSPLSNEFPQFGIHTSGISISLSVFMFSRLGLLLVGPVSVCNNFYFVQIRVKRAPNRRKELGDTEKVLTTIKTKKQPNGKLTLDGQKLRCSLLFSLQKSFIVQANAISG